MQKLSFVIPCYRSEKTITQVVLNIEKEIAMNSKYDYEVILVDDGSPDNVGNVIKDICRCNTKVKGVFLSKNFGQHPAIMAGYSHVSGDFIVSMDDDGQTPPSEVFKLIDELNKGYDLVCASYAQKKHNIFRNIGSKVNDIMAEKLLNKPKEFKMSSYFICKRFLVDEVIKYDGPYPYIQGLFLRVTSNISNVEVLHKEREIGTSGYSLRTLVSLWLNGFTAFSIKPLRIATVIGFIISLLGFTYAVYTISMKLLVPGTPIGYASLMSIIVFLGGLILIILGLIGEYIGRIYMCINKSPQFAVRSVIDRSNVLEAKNEN